MKAGGIKKWKNVIGTYFGGIKFKVSKIAERRRLF